MGFFSKKTEMVSPEAALSGRGAGDAGTGDA